MDAPSVGFVMFPKVSKTSDFIVLCTENFSRCGSRARMLPWRGRRDSLGFSFLYRILLLTGSTTVSTGLLGLSRGNKGTISFCGERRSVDQGTMERVMFLWMRLGALLGGARFVAVNTLTPSLAGGYNGFGLHPSIADKGY